jgi:hypothetical protein
MDNYTRNFIHADAWKEHFKATTGKNLPMEDFIRQYSLISSFPLNKKRQRLEDRYLRNKFLTELCDLFLGKPNPNTGKKYTYNDIAQMYDPNYRWPGISLEEHDSNLILHYPKDRDVNRWFRVNIGRRNINISGDQVKKIVFRHREYILRLGSHRNSK